MRAIQQRLLRRIKGDTTPMARRRPDSTQWRRANLHSLIQIMTCLVASPAHVKPITRLENGPDAESLFSIDGLVIAVLWCDDFTSAPHCVAHRGPALSASVYFVAEDFRFNITLRSGAATPLCSIDY